MSDFNINHITNKNGEQGPTIAGITTVNSTGAMRIPSGRTNNGKILKEDPYYEFGSILTPFNEKKWATKFRDRSKYNDEWVTNGGVDGNDNGKFYPIGAYFDGTDDRLEIPQTLSSDGYEIGSRFSTGKFGSWTWETWCNHSGSQTGTNSLLVDNTVDQVSNGYYGKTIFIAGEDGILGLNFQHNGGADLTRVFDSTVQYGGYVPTVNYTSDAWNHLAISFDGPSGVWRNFVNGNLAGTVAYADQDDILEKNGVDPASIDKFLVGIDANLDKSPPRRDFRSAKIHVGANHNNAHDLKGYLNDYRFYNGVCKYKESFTPPTQMAFGVMENDFSSTY